MSRQIWVDRHEKAAYVIHGPAEPITYSWTPVLAPGHHLEAASNGDVMAVTNDGSNARMLATPFAIDSNDAAIPVSYTIQGGTIAVTVSHTQPGVEYPVIADTNPNEYNSTVFAEMHDELMRHLGETTPPASDADYEIEDVVEDTDMPASASETPNYPPNAREKAFCRDWPLLCLKFDSDKRKANKLTEHLFGSSVDSTKSNAFLHSFWVALMVESIESLPGDAGDGYYLALDFSTRHEDEKWLSSDFDTSLISYMDLHNNDVGWYFADDHARDHNDEYMCSGMKNKVSQGKYSRHRPAWDDPDQLVWIKNRRRGLIRGRDCGPA